MSTARYLVVLGCIAAGTLAALYGGIAAADHAYTSGVESAVPPPSAPAQPTLAQLGYSVDIATREPVLLAAVDTPTAPPAEPGIATSPAVAPAPPDIADPVAAPGDFIDDVRNAYQWGGWLGVTLLIAYALLMLLQRWIAYLRTGWRKVVIASAFTALIAMIAALSEGEPPSLSLIVNALVAAALLAIRTGVTSGGEPSRAVK